MKMKVGEEDYSETTEIIYLLWYLEGQFQWLKHDLFFYYVTPALTVIWKALT